jgi:aminopeptidase
MKDQRVEKMARVLVEYSTEVKANELVSIRGPYSAEPLMLALYKECLDKGAHPVLRPNLPAAQPLLYRFAADHQLEYLWEPEKWYVENLDVDFSIIADTNTRQLSQIDPARQVLAAKARRPVLDRRMERGAAGDLRWNVTLFPTEAIAMDAEMSLDEYEDFFYAACLLDASDPIAEWKKVAEVHAGLLSWIEGRKEVHIEGDGTDLYLDVGGRTFVGADGTANFPDGEIFTGPVEDGTNGVVTFSFPAIYGGQSVEGIRLEFSEGKVVDASAQKNEDFLLRTLDTDAGSRTLGELGIGTNFGIAGFSGEILLDEKIGGTVHLAVGASYPETGGVNRSAVHWDMVCDLRSGGRITVDRETLMEDGKLAV